MDFKNISVLDTIRILLVRNIHIKKICTIFKELQSNDTHYTYKLKTCDQKLLTDYGSTLNKSI